MWIRSQKKIVFGEPNGLYIKKFGEDDYTIIDSISDLIYGTYNTKERAIQVLDEIQMATQSFEEDKLYNLSPQSTNYRLICFTYQMPEE